MEGGGRKVHEEKEGEGRKIGVLREGGSVTGRVIIREKGRKRCVGGGRQL